MSNPLCGGTSAPHLSFFTADVVVTVREGGRRPWLLDAIDQDTVDELVGEADQALDPGGLVDRFRIVPDDLEIGRAHVCTPVTNAHLVCRRLLEKKYTQTPETKSNNNDTKD